MHEGSKLVWLVIEARNRQPNGWEMSYFDRRTRYSEYEAEYTSNAALFVLSTTMFYIRLQRDGTLKSEG